MFACNGSFSTMNRPEGETFVHSEKSPWPTASDSARVARLFLVYPAKIWKLYEDWGFMPKDYVRSHVGWEFRPRRSLRRFVHRPPGKTPLRFPWDF